MFIADLAKQETDRRERAKIARAGGIYSEVHRVCSPQTKERR